MNPIQWFLKILEKMISSVLSKKRLLNQAAIMVAARTLGMGFAAAGSIWAARCMGPRNYGISGMVLSVVAQTSLVFGLMSPTVLVREYKNTDAEKERNDLIRTATTFTFLLSVSLAAIGIILFTLHLFPKEYHFAGWFFAPLLICTTLQPSWVFQAAERQHFESMIAVLQPFLMAALYLALFKPGMPAGSDLAVNASVCVVVTTVYWFAVYRLTSFRGTPFRWETVKRLGGLIRKSAWLFISGLAIYVYTTLEQPLLGWLYSVEELGKYRTALQLTNAAASILGMTAILLFPRFLEWRKRGLGFLWNRQVKLGWLFAGLGIVGAVGIFFLMPRLYSILFGAQFARAAVPAAILITSKLVVVVSGVFVWGLRTDRHYDKLISFFFIGVACFSLLSNLLFVPKFGMYATALTNL
ncbi:MAG: oligosaccharide flippase family protein, partial [bacterium]